MLKAAEPKSTTEQIFEKGLTFSASTMKVSLRHVTFKTTLSIRWTLTNIFLNMGPLCVSLLFVFGLLKQ